jgi:hypothetical protein
MEIDELTAFKFDKLPAKTHEVHRNLTGIIRSVRKLDHRLKAC